MGRVFTMVRGAAAVAAGLTISAPAAMATSAPVSAVIKHGIYKAVVVCPHWNGPAGGPAPLLAAPLEAKSANPRPGHLVPQPVYSPLVTCAITFFKDAPLSPPKSRRKGSAKNKGTMCPPDSGLMSARHPARLVRVCCADLRQAMRSPSSCLMLEAGFGGMARQVSRHEPVLHGHRHS